LVEGRRAALRSFCASSSHEPPRTTRAYSVVAGTSGFGGYWAPTYSRLLVYKLGGTATLPEPAQYAPPVLDPPAEFGDAGQLAKGEAEYNAHCGSCHGNNTRVSSIFPDLRYASALQSADLFKAIVIDGVLQANGMVSFAKVLTPTDAEAIRAHVVRLANLAKNAPPGLGFGPGSAPGPAPPPGAPPATPAPPLHQ